MKKIQFGQIALFAIINVILLSTLNADNAVPALKDPIIVGQSAVLSGNILPYQRAINNGISACFKKINEDGGIDGHKLLLKVVDNKNNADQAHQDIKQMVDEGISLFMGNTGSRNILANMPLVRDKKIAMLFPWGSNLSLEKARYTYMINGINTIQAQIKKLVDYLASSLQHKKIAIVHADGDFGIQNAAYARKIFKTYGINPMNIRPYNSKTLKISRTIEDLHQLEPRAILFLSTSRPAAKIIKEIVVNGGYTTDFVGLDSTLFVPKLLDNQGVSFSYSSTVPGVEQSKFPVVREYIDASKKYFPNEDLNSLSLTYYINTKILVEALKRLSQQGLPPNKENVISAIEKIKNHDIGGFLANFDKRTRVAYPLHISIIKG